jgi:uncharacterized protein (TIGR02646 family)
MMRPVEKGSAPRAYAVYQDAATDLQDRLGRYCSYCERQIETHLAVEHVQPKSRHARLRTAWKNLLLACVHCNSNKGRRHISLSGYYWPDRDNTLRAIVYVAGGLVTPRRSTSPLQRAKTVATIELTGLDKYPGNAGREPTDSDQRWLRRQEAWTLARRYVTLLATNNTPEFRDLIVDVATGRGMFSIWWTAFAGDADMRRRLQQAFAGTCPNSFNANGHLKARPGGQL